jgi:hypothetical protein
MRVGRLMAQAVAQTDPWPLRTKKQNPANTISAHFMTGGYPAHSKCQAAKRTAVWMTVPPAIIAYS